MICSKCGNLIHPEQLMHEEHINGCHTVCPPSIQNPRMVNSRAKVLAREIWDKYINSDHIRGIEDLEADIMKIMEGL